MYSERKSCSCVAALFPARAHACGGMRKNSAEFGDRYASTKQWFEREEHKIKQAMVSNHVCVRAGSMRTLDAHNRRPSIVAPPRHGRQLPARRPILLSYSPAFVVVGRRPPEEAAPVQEGSTSDRTESSLPPSLGLSRDVRAREAFLSLASHSLLSSPLLSDRRCLGFASPSPLPRLLYQ